MSPCSLCTKQNRRCVVDKERSNRCSECVRAKSACDVKPDSWQSNVPSSNDWEAIARQKERLEEQEDEAMAKLLRLRKQRKLLIRREAELAKRGLKFLDELDAVEAQEREAAADPVPPSSASEVPINDDLISALSPSFWQQWDASGGNPLTTPDS